MLATLFSADEGIGETMTFSSPPAGSGTIACQLAVEIRGEGYVKGSVTLFLTIDSALKLASAANTVAGNLLLARDAAEGVRP